MYREGGACWNKSSVLVKGGSRTREVSRGRLAAAAFPPAKGTVSRGEVCEGRDGGERKCVGVIESTQGPRSPPFLAW